MHTEKSETEGFSLWKESFTIWTSWPWTLSFKNISRLSISFPKCLQRSGMKLFLSWRNSRHIYVWVHGFSGRGWLWAQSPWELVWFGWTLQWSLQQSSQGFMYLWLSSLFSLTGGPFRGRLSRRVLALQSQHCWVFQVSGAAVFHICPAFGVLLLL